MVATTGFFFRSCWISRLPPRAPPQYPIIRVLHTRPAVAREGAARRGAGAAPNEVARQRIAARAVDPQDDARPALVLSHLLAGVALCPCGWGRPSPVAGMPRGGSGRSSIASSCRAETTPLRHRLQSHVPPVNRPASKARPPPMSKRQRHAACCRTCRSRLTSSGAVMVPPVRLRTRGTQRLHSCSRSMPEGQPLPRPALLSCQNIAANRACQGTDTGLDAACSGRQRGARCAAHDRASRPNDSDALAPHQPERRGRHRRIPLQADLRRAARPQRRLSRARAHSTTSAAAAMRQL